jgi:hypothetical protein
MRPAIKADIPHGTAALAVSGGLASDGFGEGGGQSGSSGASWCGCVVGAVGEGEFERLALPLGGGEAVGRLASGTPVRSWELGPREETHSAPDGLSGSLPLKVDRRQWEPRLV